MIEVAQPGLDVIALAVQSFRGEFGVAVRELAIDGRRDFLFQVGWSRVYMPGRLRYRHG